MADVVIINKIDSAEPAAIDRLYEGIRAVNPKATVIEAASPLTADHPERIPGRRALVVEDGPTLTHGEMKIGAGTVMARKLGARELVDPRPWAVGTIAETYRKYPGIGTLLPAMGYGDQQIKDLEATIDNVPADVVVVGTPINLGRIVSIRKPTVRVTYELQEIGQPTLETVLAGFIRHARTGQAVPA